LLLEAEFEHVNEIVSGFGKLGVPAEQLAKRAAGRMAGYLESTAYAGPYLADQLLLPFAGDGEFTTVKPSQHSLTAAAIIAKFFGLRCELKTAASGMHRLTVSRRCAGSRVASSDPRHDGRIARAEVKLEQSGASGLARGDGEYFSCHLQK
jgi:hypothetical protein